MPRVPWVAQVPADEEFDWAARYQSALRSLPLAAGAAGLLGVLVNRLVSGVRVARTITNVGHGPFDAYRVAVAVAQPIPMLPMVSRVGASHTCLPFTRPLCQTLPTADERHAEAPDTDGFWPGLGAPQSGSALHSASAYIIAAAVTPHRCQLQIAPVVDASSAQSRADVVLIAMSAVLLLTGLQWAALTPREAEPVEPDGSEVAYYDDSLPKAAVEELRWCAAIAMLSHTFTAGM